MNSLRKKSGKQYRHNRFKKLKYMGINLMKEVKNPYNENHKSLFKISKLLLEPGHFSKNLKFLLHSSTILNISGHMTQRKQKKRSQMYIICIITFICL
jgi:hypothetical protein